MENILALQGKHARQPLKIKRKNIKEEQLIKPGRICDISANKTLFKEHLGVILLNGFSPLVSSNLLN